MPRRSNLDGGHKARARFRARLMTRTGSYARWIYCEANGIGKGRARKRKRVGFEQGLLFTQGAAEQEPLESSDSPSRPQNGLNGTSSSTLRLIPDVLREGGKGASAKRVRALPVVSHRRRHRYCLMSVVDESRRGRRSRQQVGSRSHGTRYSSPIDG